MAGNRPKALHFNVIERSFIGETQLQYLSYIEKHVKAIENQYQKPEASPYPQFNDDAFWEGCRQKANHNPAFDVIYQDWKKVAPLAHLNAKELSNLLINEVKPVLMRHQEMLDVMAQEDKALARLPLYFKHRREGVRKQIEENKEALLALQNDILIGLVIRTLGYQYHDEPRQLDNIYFILANRLNQLPNFTINILKNELSQELTLDDNLRILVYDLLESHNALNAHVMASTATATTTTTTTTLTSPIVATKEILDKLVKPIPRPSFALLKTKNEIENQKQQFLAACKKMGKKHPIQSRASRLYGYQQQFNPSGDWRDIPYALLNQVYQHKLLVALGICLILTHFALSYLGPVMTLILGGTAAAVASGLFFLAFGFAPIWRFVWREVAHQFNLKKEQHIVEAVHELQKVQQLISHTLVQTPLDLAHSAISDLKQAAEEAKTTLSDWQSVIKEADVWDNVFQNIELEESLKEIDKLCQEKLNEIPSVLQDMAQHIGERIGDAIEIQEIHARLKKLVPTMTDAQIAQLRLFVEDYGSEKALSQFEEGANIIARWALKIKDSVVQLSNNAKLATQVPWGGFSIRKDFLNGWETLVKTIASDWEEKEACLKLNALLSGNAVINEQELEKHTGLLTPRGVFKSAIQDVLFKTLDSRPEQVTRLLSINQQNSIISWFNANLKLIQKANEDMKQLFSFFSKPRELNQEIVVDLNANPNNNSNSGDAEDNLDNSLENAEHEARMNDWENHTTLLKAAMYGQALVHHEMAPENTMEQTYRDYIKNYQGNTTPNLGFIDLFSEIEQLKLEKDLLNKRINWFIEHLDTIDLNDPFTDGDIIAFTMRGGTEGGFDMDEVVSKSSAFILAESPMMVTFMEKCILHMLGLKRETLEEYRTRFQFKQKPLLQQQQLIDNNNLDNNDNGNIIDNVNNNSNNEGMKRYA